MDESQFLLRDEDASSYLKLLNQTVKDHEIKINPKVDFPTY